jgi:hypothetical protein
VLLGFVSGLCPGVPVLRPDRSEDAPDLDMRADALLMAVAVGAGRDLLTLICHQRNTLGMGPRSYRFGD